MHLLSRRPSCHFTKAQARSGAPCSLPAGDDPIAVAIAFVAGQNDGPGKILRLHACDTDSYCSACRVRPVRWPCPVAAIALRALEIRGTETTPIDPPRGRLS
jgi:hypothetical protein